MPADRNPLWSGPRDARGDHDWLEHDPERAQGVPSGDAPWAPPADPARRPAAGDAPRRRTGSGRSGATSRPAGRRPGVAPPPPPPAQPGRPIVGPGAARVALGVLVVAVVALVGVIGGIYWDGGPRGVRTVQQPAVAQGAVAPTSAAKLYAAASPGVVQIRTGTGSGTGFVVERDGTIVTNAHVVEGASDVQVSFDDDAQDVQGRVLGRDTSSDLAVVRVDPDDVDRLAPLELGDSDDVRAGDQALAIGYPLGLDRTLTEGIVSGIGRQIQAPDGFSIDKVIQTDAPINPGNSGGPLLDAKGRVVGVNSQIASAGRGGGNVGIGFAVPSNTVKDVIPTLEQGRRVKRPWLGVSLAEAASGQSANGAGVAEVQPGGPGARAGLRGATGTGRIGDVIVAVDGQPIKSADGLTAALSGHKVGEQVELRVQRDGREITVRATLGERPASASTGSSQGGSPGFGSPNSPSPSPGTP